MRPALFLTLFFALTAYATSSNLQRFAHRMKCKTGPVQNAWITRGHPINYGSLGTVYPVKKHFKNAVLKRLIGTNQLDDNRYVETLIRNLRLTEQFLAYGHSDLDGTENHYIIMKYMGMSADNTGLPDSNLHSHRLVANDLYETKFGLKEGATKIWENNYVYRKDGRWKAEIIYWQHAKYNDNAEKKANELPAISREEFCPMH